MSLCLRRAERHSGQPPNQQPPHGGNETGVGFSYGDKRDYIDDEDGVGENLYQFLQVRFLPFSPFLLLPYMLWERECVIVDGWIGRFFLLFFLLLPGFMDCASVISWIDRREAKQRRDLTINSHVFTGVFPRQPGAAGPPFLHLWGEVRDMSLHTNTSMHASCCLRQTCIHAYTPTLKRPMSSYHTTIPLC